MENVIQEKFEKMGARIKVFDREGGWPTSIDIRRDDRGEYFELRSANNVNVSVVDVRPSDRHLLMMIRHEDGQRGKFLCGHDERAWFVAAIPETARVANVQDAKDALKPQAVWDAMREFGVSMNRRDHRKTAAFVRQGEWFFIPRPKFRMDVRFALRNEPIRRGAGKPHLCQRLYRTGGEVVYVNGRYPNGLTVHQFMKLPRLEQQAWDWRKMTRDAKVYVKGSIRHPDHKTIFLQEWHEVVMNTETRSRAMQHVAFLD